MNSDHSVDVESLCRLLDHQINGGVDGVFMLGSTGEVAFLTREHRRRVLKAAVEHVAGRVPVLAGVIDMTTPLVLEHVSDAVAAGVDGIVATAPFYTRTHPAEIAGHLRAIKNAIGNLPLFAYDIPVCVHVKLDPDFVLDLAADGILAGVKDSTGSDHGIRTLVVGKKKRGLTDFSVLTGSEITVDSAYFYGVDGVVPGLGNVDPAGYVRLARLAAAGDLAAARAEQERLIELFGLVKVGDQQRMGGGSSALGAFKGALVHLGIIDHWCTAPPAITLDDSEFGAIKPFLADAGLL
ncbi:MAG: dihydrodipicolinate synthase family protein [Actinomycetota bacterium]|nr:dihydrodipicolinate synthase family protein [Actinomycetota bacterium]